MKGDPVALRDRVSRHDLRYDFVPPTFFEGFPLGNGDLGAVLWFEEDCLVLSLDKADIWERRADQSLEPGLDFHKALQQVRDGTFDPQSRLFNCTRPTDRVWGNKLPVGRVEWPLPEGPPALEGRAALYEAAFSLELRFPEGGWSIWGYLHAHENLVLLDWEAYGAVSLPEARVRVRCLDERSQEVLRIWKYPDPECGCQGEGLYATQIYSGDEKYIVFARTEAETRGRATCSITVMRGRADDGLPAQAAAYLQRLPDHRRLFEQHTAWWAEFWARSQLSLPDPALERLWYLEMYKLGCNARADKYPLTIMGVWNPDTRLPPCYGDLHHNLETEMNYWPVFASNHLELARPLYELLERELPRFRENCQSFFGWDGAHLPANMDIYGQGVGFLWFPWNLQMGVGAWLGQHFWLHYLYSGDRAFLREKAWPFLEAVGRFWLGFLEPDAEGVLHVPWSYSPEYDDVVRKGRDSAFDLSLVRSLFTLLIEAGEHLGLAADTTAPYRRARERLAPLPVDETGIQVYAGKPLTRSHRHFSHLLAIYPLGFLHIEGTPEERELIDRSLAHLRHIGTGHWAGWSFPWAALLAARTRRPGMAYAMLRFYTDHVILHNTMQVSGDWKRTGFYSTEHGLINTLEAGAGAAAAIMEMLLQSWGGRIRLFPCLPEEWTEAAFTTLRAEGAFLVSASFREGRVEWVRITSEAGNRCVVRNPWGTGEVLLRDLRAATATSLSGTDIVFPTEPNGLYELTGPPIPDRPRRARPGLADLPRWD